MSKNTTMRRLGDYIRQVDERNSNGEISLSQGICNQKYFQDPKQVSATPHLDKIVRTGQFAYNRATTRNGDKISIALREGPDCTVSSAYCVFVITDENVIDPHWLWLWFKRPEFDRYAIFKSHGSAHEFFEFETMSNVMLPVPPIEEQREIVARHKVIEHKIDVNRRLIAKLEETARTIYHHTFVENIDPENLPAGMFSTTILGFCKEIKSGGTPSRSNKKYWNSNDYRWLKTGEVHNCIIHDTEEYISEDGLNNSSAKLIEEGSIIMAMYGATAAQVGYLDCTASTNQACCNMTCFTHEQAAYLYFHLLLNQDEIKRLANGGAQENLSQELIANQSIIGVTDDALLRPFESILNQIIILSKESSYLLEMLNISAL